MEFFAFDDPIVAPVTEKVAECVKVVAKAEEELAALYIAKTREVLVELRDGNDAKSTIQAAYFLKRYKDTFHSNGRDVKDIIKSLDRHISEQKALLPQYTQEPKQSDGLSQDTDYLEDLKEETMEIVADIRNDHEHSMGRIGKVFYNDTSVVVSRLAEQMKVRN